MSKKEATIIQNFNAEKRKYEYSIKGYDVTKSIEILLKKHKEEYDKERRVFESTKGYLEAQQEYEKHIANLQSQLDQANERLNKKDEEFGRLSCDYKTLLSHYNVLKEKAIVPRFEYGDKVYYIKYFVGKWQVFNQEYVGENISNIIVRTMNYYSELPKDSVFATEQEAQTKLQELRGRE